MPYAATNQISTAPIEGGIEITEDQYAEAVASIEAGNFLFVSVEGGIFSTSPAPQPPESQTPEEQAHWDRLSEIAGEDAWRAAEVAFITDQLIALEDGDPSAMPGTVQQWREYRTAVRGWKDGAPGFPEPSARPSRPA